MAKVNLFSQDILAQKSAWTSFTARLELRFAENSKFAKENFERAD